MRTRNTFATTIAILLAAATVWPSAAEALAPESKRLIRARDYIADEKWQLAIEQLRLAVDDPKESRRDEALYWLAHSQYHSGDATSAVTTISRLERDFPRSMWVKNAQSLRIDIAVRLHRRDVLWWTAMGPEPPRGKTPAPGPKFGPRPDRGDTKAPPPPTPVDGSIPPPAQPAPDSPKAVTTKSTKAWPALPPPPPAIWMPDGVSPGADAKILALGALMRLDDADKVVPILGDIALEGDFGPAVQAVFTLAQSRSPKAQEAVVHVAKTASEPVRVAAVRDLGRFGGPDISRELLSVYTTATVPVKEQIVNSLGERSEQKALFQIVQLEKDGTLRLRAITKLGQAGGVIQLSGMYKSANVDGKRSIIAGLYFARADDALIAIADAEKTAGNEELCGVAVERLRMLDTPKAKAYLLNVPKKR
jgi:hypothetical protein